MNLLKTLGVVAVIYFGFAGIHEGFQVRSYVKDWLHPQENPFYSSPTSSTQVPPKSTRDRENEKAVELLNHVKPPEVPAPADHPPLKIVVGGDTWTIRYTTYKALVQRNCGGFEDNKTHEIWLPKIPRYQNIKETVLHELLHVSLEESRNPGGNTSGWYTEVNYNNDENSFVEPMAPALLQILQDNPELVAWLTR